MWWDEQKPTNKLNNILIKFLFKSKHWDFIFIKVLLESQTLTVIVSPDVFTLVT